VGGTTRVESGLKTCNTPSHGEKGGESEKNGENEGGVHNEDFPTRKFLKGRLHYLDSGEGEGSDFARRDARSFSMPALYSAATFGFSRSNSSRARARSWEGGTKGLDLGEGEGEGEEGERNSKWTVKPQSWA